MVVALRPAQTFGGIDNRSVLYPTGCRVFNKGANPVVLNLVQDATITGGAWTANGGESVAETNAGGTASGGAIVNSYFIKGGECKDIELHSFEKNRRGIRRKSIVTGYQNQSLQVLTMEAAQSADVRASLNWDEVRA